MNTLNPSRASTARNTFRMPQSRSQPRLGLNRNISEGGKQASFTESFQDSTSVFPTSRPSRKQSPSKKLLNKITDYYDKKQISNAVSSAKNLNDRVKLIDSIVKHRTEIQEIEKQTHFDRLAPVLLKMGQNLRKKVISKAAENSVRRSFLPEAVLLASPADSLTSFITETDIMSDSSRKGSVCEKRESIFSEAQPVSAQQTARENGALPPIMLTTADSFRMEPLFEAGPNKQSNFAPKGNEKKKQSFILALLAKKTNKPGSSPRGLVFRSDVKEENFSAKMLKLAKNNPKRNPDGSISRDVYGLGSKVLEMDLYKYLVKNQDKEAARKFITENNKEAKEPFMRDIESKAKSKFVEFVHHKKQANYRLPNSYSVEKKRAEQDNFLQGSCKCTSYELNSDEVTDFKPKTSVPKYIKSSAMIRNAEQEVFNDPYGFIFNSKEKEFTGNDESFASLTETKLDDLYRKTYKINKKLAIATENLNRSTKKSEVKKWEEEKQKQSKSLLENSTEALRTIKRKINQKAF